MKFGAQNKLLIMNILIGIDIWKDCKSTYVIYVYFYF